ncbi:MAG TPA: NYN domain-containing protein, partial [Isosphaeraceae bacterium]
MTADGPRPFDTAFFWDIENLTRGYGRAEEAVATLSLAAIVAGVRATADIGRIAVNRAYANWSDRRLSGLRHELFDLGIEPVQVFDFNFEVKKNNADFHLVIDAVELLHTRPTIDHYVIVTGDGGYAALVRKLHEHGKTVVGAAFEGSDSVFLKKLCDAFIPVAAPAGPAPAPAPAPADQVQAAMAKILRRFRADPTGAEMLHGSGIGLTDFDKKLREKYPDFKPDWVGARTFSEAVGRVAEREGLAVVVRDLKMRLVLAETSRPGSLSPPLAAPQPGPSGAVAARDGELKLVPAETSRPGNPSPPLAPPQPEPPGPYCDVAELIAGLPPLAHRDAPGAFRAHLRQILTRLRDHPGHAAPLRDQGIFLGKVGAYLHGGIANLDKLIKRHFPGRKLSQVVAALAPELGLEVRKVGADGHLYLFGTRSAPARPMSNGASSGPRFAGLLQAVPPRESHDSAAGREQLDRLLAWIEADGDCAAWLRGPGIPIHHVNRLIREVLPGFQPKALGHARLKDVLADSCGRVGLDLAYQSPTDLRLVFGGVRLGGLAPAPLQPEDDG